eukprot:3940928-Prymnesium_polylepis.1
MSSTLGRATRTMWACSRSRRRRPRPLSPPPSPPPSPPTGLCGAGTALNEATQQCEIVCSSRRRSLGALPVGGAPASDAAALLRSWG